LRAALLSGFRVIAVDLPGSGRSEPQPRSYTAGYYYDDARALLGLLDALGISLAHLAGFSDGGEAAVLMAGLRPGPGPVPVHLGRGREDRDHAG
jgi:valacyclovir hydrolase